MNWGAHKTEKKMWGSTTNISYSCIPGDAWLLPEGPACLGKESMGFQRRFQVKASLIWLLLNINCCSALVIPVMGQSAQLASLRGLFLLWGVGQKHIPLLRVLWEEWKGWGQQQVPCCSHIKGFCNEGIPQLLFSFLSFIECGGGKRHQDCNCGQTQT